MSSHSHAQTLPVKIGGPRNGAAAAIGSGRRRSWMLTFADVLLQLLAFFIMRFAIAPYRLGTAPKPQPPVPALTEQASLPTPTTSTKPPREEARPLRLLNFRSLAVVDGIEAELDKSLLPERVDELSFSLSEDLATLGASFGGGDYLLTISESRCNESERLAKSAIIAEELVQRGIPPQCLQWAEEQTCSNPEMPGTMTIGIVQKKCDPFVVKAPSL